MLNQKDDYVVCDVVYDGVCDAECDGVCDGVCDGMCEGVFDDVCDGMYGGKGCDKVKWLILRCLEVLVTIDGQMVKWTNKRTYIGHFWVQAKLSKCLDLKAIFVLNLLV